LAALQKIDPSVARFDEMHTSAHYQLEDLSRELSAYAESAEGDPERLAAVERRRDLIFRITKKYGGSEASAVEQLESAQRELALLDDIAPGGETLDQELRAAREELSTTASALSTLRSRAARELSADVAAVLPSLGLTTGGFSVEIRPLAEPGPDGAEEIEFMAALNVGHAARPLARIASGGELSRVMLAIKTIVAQLDHVPTLVFDEVDAGIGGAVALQVGDAIRRVADHHQVFAITHLPQIAARASNHIVVSKDARGGITTAGTVIVNGEERIREIARMLGGDPESRAGQEHAQELLANAAPVSSPRAGRTRARKSGSR
jgi:DNA repair protein RecN (Recombination protein N)